MAIGQSETRYLFLDKDGTLIPDLPYNVDPQNITLQPGAARGLRRLAEAGFRFVIVSNQSGVARGFFKEKALEAVAERMHELLEKEAGATLEGFYYCPHHPQGSQPGYAIQCDCRKPLPGLLFQAASDLAIALDEAWMVGDILNDIEAGLRAGCRTILINNGGETEWRTGPFRQPDFIAGDLEEAAEIILSETRRQSAGSLSRSSDGAS